MFDLNINRKRRVHYDGEVKDTKLTLTTNVSLDDPQATVRRAGETHGCVAVRVLSQRGCELCLLIPETLALLGAGQYELVLMDGCDECDVVPIQATDDCYITSMKTQMQTKRKVCGEC